MYLPTTRFPESTNREDLVRTIGINDDDTGDPLNLAGILSLNIQNGFTGSNWIIIDGIIQTTSVTTFTVPGYPVGNQLSALAITVGANLAIVAHDFVTIADANGNATISGIVQSYTPSNGSLVVQIGYTFQLEIRKPRHHFIDDYSPWYDFGGGPSVDNSPAIMASLGNGLTIVDLGMLQIRIPEMTMRTLWHRTYTIALTMTDTDDTRQIFVGSLPVLYGGVTN